MDKLKNALTVLKKYHFWILCGLSIVIALGVWSLATADLASQTETRQQKLEGDVKKMVGICSTKDHPNEEVVQAYKKLEALTATNALAAWTTLYGEQDKNNQLPEVLSDDFKAYFRSLKGPDDTLDWEYLSEYQNFIGEHIPKLFEQLDLRRPAGGAEPSPGPVAPRQPTTSRGGGGGDSGGSTEPEMIGIVTWNDTEPMTKRFQFPGQQPTTQQVVRAQEDLWVYEALIRVIRNTNLGATRSDNAPIHTINALLIGEDVDGTGQNPTETTIDLGAAAAGAAKPELNASRYVDDKGLPLAGPPYKHPYAEFRMMPVRMGLEIKQTKIPTLLAECANSKMPIEVRRFRFNPGEGATLNLRQAPGPAAGERSGKGVVTYPTASQESPSSADKSYVSIEIDGIICIYEKPDREKLGTGAAAEEPETATQPAGTPPDTTSSTPPAAASDPAAAGTPATDTGPGPGGQPPNTGG